MYFYPTHSADGWLVYDGDDEMVVDTRLLPYGATRYYTIFAFDESGNVSTGVVAFIRHRGLFDDGQPGSVREDQTGVEDLPPELDAIRDDDRTSTTTGSDPVATEPTFTFNDIQFVQAGVLKTDVGAGIALDGGLPTTITVPYELVPEHLKTIVMTLEHPDDRNQVFSFLLRVNSDKSGYEALIGPLHTGGVYTTILDVYDFKTQSLFSVGGSLSVSTSGLGRRLEDVDRAISALTPWSISKPGYFWLWILLLSLLLVAYYLIRRQRKL